MVTDSNFSYAALASSDLHRLPREGDLAIAYQVAGAGRLVVCVPGMGDLRSTFRYTVPALVAAGYRVAWMDLRGHGDSDTGFSSYDDVALASDIAALIAALGGSAVVVGNSMGAGAAVIAAAERPEIVDGLVLVGPFVRNGANGGSRTLALMLRLLLLRPWGPTAWAGYFASLSPQAKAADWADHSAEIRQSLALPGRWRAFQHTAVTTHAPAEAVVGAVTAPTLVVMGAVDRDFPDPAAEAQWIADSTGGTVLMVPDAGHYPQSDRADLVSPAMITFLAGRVGTGSPRG